MTLSPDCPTPRSRLPFLAGGLLALVLTQLLYGALVLSALDRQYEQPMLEVRALICEDLGRRLDRLARLGKDPDRIPRLEDTLAPYASEQVDSLLILDASGAVLAGWGKARGAVLPLSDQAQNLTPTVRTFSRDAVLWLTRPILDHRRALRGHVALGVNKSRHAAMLWQTVHDNIALLTAITLGAGLLLILFVTTPWTTHGAPAQRHAPLPPKKMYAALILPLLLGQLLFAVVLRSPLRTMNEQHLHHIGTQLGSHLAVELEHILGMGLSLKQLPPVAEHLISLQSGLSGARALAILDTNNTVLHAADTNGSLDQDAWEALAKRAPVSTVSIDGPSGQVGHVHALMDDTTVAANLRAITWDTLTMTVIALIFMTELAGFLLLREEHRHTTANAGSTPRPRSMRPIIFAAMFAIDLSISFVPLRLKELSPTLFSLPPDVLLGLPVSVEMFMVGIAILLGGFLSEKTDARPLLLLGIGLAALGNLGSALAATPLVYISARGIAGAGYGLINMAAQLFVIAHSDPGQRARNLAAVFAGLFAGALCGSASGGLIADRLGYAAVFHAAALLLGILCLTLFFTLPRRHMPKAGNSTPWPSMAELARFLLDRRMAALLFLNIVPCAFVTVCLFQFFIPVFLHHSGAGPADIGRVVMVFPLVIVYLGPLFGQWADRSHHKGLYLTGAGLLGAAGVGALLLWDGIPGATLAVFLLGICNAVVSNAQGAYALELPATEAFGASKAVGIYNVAERMGQVLGPVTLGAVLALWGTGLGLGLMAAMLGIASLGFWLTVGSPRHDVS